MIIPIIGKGGVGKTTVTALLLRRLLDARKTPVLAIDADPSSCLGAVLGVEIETTLGTLRDRLRDDPNRPQSMAKSDWLAFMAEEAIIEEKGYDLLTMGHPEGPGCYCFVNNLLRDYLERLGKNYRIVLIDCEAGQEHLSRRTTARPDHLVCVTNRSRMGALTIQRSLELFERLHGMLPSTLELVLNGISEDDERLHDLTAAATYAARPFDRIWNVPEAPEISRADAAGTSILEVQPVSTAIHALQGWEELL
jgi:CO dehydrogenase maturation factor